MMKRFVLMFAAIGLLFACTPEENKTGDNNANDGTVHVTGISLDRPTATIKEGKSFTLDPTIIPDNADNKAVTWFTSNETVAIVDNNGKVTGIKVGSATITAMTEDGGKKATCALTVEANLAPSVTVGAEHISAVSVVLNGKANIINNGSSTMIMGFQYYKLSGSTSPTAITVLATDPDKDYNYSVSISELEPNTSYLYYSFARQNGQDTYGEAKEFTTKDIASLLETNEASDVEATKATLNAKLDMTDVLYKSLAYGFLWGTSESALNTDFKCTEIKDNAISADLTNLSSGTQYWYKAYVQLDSQTLYGEVKTFTTVQWVTSISLSKTTLSLVIGSEETLSVTSVLPGNANDKTYTWASSDNAIATVDNSGKVTAKAKGKTAIKATANDGSGVFASCGIVVSSKCPDGAVDMGTKTKEGYKLYWATCNLSESGFVSSPEEYGDYYAWGETETKDNYSWSTYKFGTSSSGPFSKYNTSSSYGTVDNKTVLETGPNGDDVASKVLGGSWRMPTDAEWTGLRNQCTWTWTTSYNGTGVAGRIVKSNVEGYKDKSICLSAAGDWNGTNFSSAGSYGYYWSSSLHSVYPSVAWPVIFYSGDVHRGYTDRYYGFSVRPVSE